MIATQLFHHLPHDELVEQKQALRNKGCGVLEPAPCWGTDLDNRGFRMGMHMYSVVVTVDTAAYAAEDPGPSTIALDFKGALTLVTNQQ